MESPYITLAVLHRLLDLAEFMERSEQALPLDIEKLGRLASESHAFAKALYYYVRPCSTPRVPSFSRYLCFLRHWNHVFGFPIFPHLPPIRGIQFLRCLRLLTFPGQPGRVGFRTAHFAQTLCLGKRIFD